MKNLLLALGVAISVNAFAQPTTATNPDCDVTTVETAANCVISKMPNAFHDQILSNAGTTPTEAETSRSSALESITTSKVANSNRATTAPDPFAARIHNSYQDFLAPLSFAINKVEESKDGQALIVRFNPLRHPPFNFGLTATAAKPVIAEAVKANIAETNRDATLGKIEKELGDFDDITLAASFTRTTEKCTSLSDVCYGRNPEIYWDLVSGPVVNLAGLASTRIAQRAARDLRDVAAAALPGVSQPGQKRLSEVTDLTQRQRLYELARIAGQADAADSRAYLTAFKAAGLENLATLLDNQPEWALNGSYRDRGPFSGADEASASLDFQVGRVHLTNIRKKLQCISDDDSCLTAALKDERISSILSDKFVLSVSYTRVSRYRLDDLGDIAADDFTPVDLKRTSEWKAKAQWGRKLAFAVTEQRPRVDVSVEFRRAAKGGDRTLNRFVSTATLTIPWSASASIPVSLSYANKPEFIADARKQLSMHFGLSYRLPWERKE